MFCYFLKTFEFVKTEVPEGEDEKSSFADLLSKYNVSLLQYYIRSLTVEM